MKMMAPPSSTTLPLRSFTSFRSSSHRTLRSCPAAAAPVRGLSFSLLARWIHPLFVSSGPRNPSFSSVEAKASGDFMTVQTVSPEDLSSSLTKTEDNLVSQQDQDDNERVENRSNETEYLGDSKMVKVCDKLIEVFMVDKPTPTDWRRLLAFSREWNSIRPHFYKHCREKADTESNPNMQHKLLRLARKLKEIDDDMQRHNELLEEILASPSEISSIIGRRHKDFTKEFFVHLHTVVESYYDDPMKQNDLSKLGNMCLAAVQAYENGLESIEALNAAELKLNDIINSPTLDAACRKIDNLAEKKELDSALMLMLTKAWSAAKESSLMKDEAKDILYHLYQTAIGNLQRLVPGEIRILRVSKLDRVLKKARISTGASTVLGIPSFRLGRHSK